MTEDCYSAQYIEVTNITDLKRLLGSKYLQAYIGNTYRKVEENLQAEKTVLFSGTSCQVNGLKRFLNNEYDNLICIDVICHGVPSPKLWRKYVKCQEAVYNGKLVSVNFRCKENGWSDYSLCETFAENGKAMSYVEKYIPKNADSYMQLFLRDYSLRPSCYSCTAKKNKLSDITLADFWGINKIMPEMNDEKGASLVIARSPKGQSVLSEIKTQFIVSEVTYEEGVRFNPSEYKSCVMPLQRKNFFKDMNKMSYESLVDKYMANRFYKMLYDIGRRIIKIKAKDACSACGACCAICPKTAITMIQDEEGFLYPQIDKNKCVGCGRCDEVCERKKVYAN